MSLQLATDTLLAFGAIKDDEVLEQAGLVVVEGLDLDRPPCAATRRQEAVAIGVGARADVLNRGALRQLGPANDERHDAAAIQEDQPPDWTRKRQVALSVLEIRIPPHLLRERHVAKQCRHEIGQDVNGRLSALAHTIGEIRSLRRLLAFECRPPPRHTSLRIRRLPASVDRRA